MPRKVFIAITITVVLVLAALALYKKGRSGSSEGAKSVARADIGTSVGKVAPAFSITTIEGKKIKSAFLRGKIVVITSAAAWCPTCVMEAKAFAPVYQEYKERGVAFITIDIDPRDQEDFIRQFAKDYHTPWYYASSQGGEEIIQKYSLNKFEITYILDRQGVIRYKDRVITSSNRLRQEIQKLL